MHTPQDAHTQTHNASTHAQAGRQAGRHARTHRRHGARTLQCTGEAVQGSNTEKQCHSLLDTRAYTHVRARTHTGDAVHGLCSVQGKQRHTVLGLFPAGEWRNPAPCVFSCRYREMATTELNYSVCLSAFSCSSVSSPSGLSLSLPLPLPPPSASPCLPLPASFSLLPLPLPSSLSPAITPASLLTRPYLATNNTWPMHSSPSVPLLS